MAAAPAREPEVPVQGERASAPACQSALEVPAGRGAQGGGALARATPEVQQMLSDPRSVVAEMMAEPNTLDAWLEAVAQLPRAQRDATLEALASACLPHRASTGLRACVVAQRLLNKRTNPPNEALGMCAQGANPVAATLFEGLRSKEMRAISRANLERKPLSPKDAEAMEQVLRDADHYDRELNARKARKQSLNLKSLGRKSFKGSLNFKVFACAMGLGAFGLCALPLPFLAIPLLVLSGALLLYAVKAPDLWAALHLRGWFNTP